MCTTATFHANSRKSPNLKTEKTCYCVIHFPLACLILDDAGVLFRAICCAADACIMLCAWIQASPVTHASILVAVAKSQLS
jgi:hypothetical protein